MAEPGAERLGATPPLMENFLMISLDGVSVRFRHTDVPVLCDVSLELVSGSIAGVTGPSGGGKTLLGLVVAGVIPDLIPAEVSGVVHRDMKDRTHRTRAAIVFQDPTFQLFARTVEEELLFTPRRLGWPETPVLHDIEQVVEGLDIAPLLNYDPRELSMGEAQRVAVGAAIMQRPQVLVLDEPTQYIDPFHVERTLEFVFDWCGRHDTAVMLIEHNIPILKRFCSRIYRVEAGRVREATPCIPEFPETTGRSEISEDALLIMEDVSYRYPDRDMVLKNISLVLRKGESVALLGPNGGGKSTLARIMCGLYTPASGEVQLVGVSGTERRARFRDVGYVMQNPDRQIFAPTVREECAFGPRNFDIPPAVYEERISRYLERFNMRDFADRDPSSLSYGEKRRINIVGVAAYDPRIIILDEPTCALDFENQRILSDLILEWNMAEKTVFIITHDLAFARAVCHRAFLLANGSLSPCIPAKRIDEHELMETYTKQ